MSSSSPTPASDESIEHAAKLLAAGKLVAVPTETVYGLGADATAADAVRAIFQAKGRPANNPLILHVASAQAALPWINVFDSSGKPIDWLLHQWELASTFWPGPLTVVVPKSPAVIDAVTAGAATVAIRVPNHPVMLALLNKCDFPIAAPSANPSNYVSPTRAQHVQSALGDKVAMILDGGPCRCGLESTIIRLRPEGVELLRPGAVSLEQLEAVFGSVTQSQATSPDPGNSDADDSTAKAMPAPGMLRKHYSPRKPMVTLDAFDPRRFPGQRFGRIAFAPLADAEASNYVWMQVLSDSGNLTEVASQLYGALRDADESLCDVIVIDTCPRNGLGRAIMDRIDRACS